MQANAKTSVEDFPFAAQGTVPLAPNELFADRAHPQLPRTLRSASHLRGLAMPVEDGLDDFSTSWTKRL